MANPTNEAMDVVIETAEDGLAALEAQLAGARQRLEDANRRREEGEQRCTQVAIAMEKLKSRLMFGELPRDVLAKRIHGKLGDTRGRAAQVCRAWRSSISLSRMLGLLGMTCTLNGLDHQWVQAMPLIVKHCG